MMIKQLDIHTCKGVNLVPNLHSAQKLVQNEVKTIKLLGENIGINFVTLVQLQLQKYKEEEMEENHLC
jgi:hypothetical protein